LDQQKSTAAALIGANASKLLPLSSNEFRNALCQSARPVRDGFADNRFIEWISSNPHRRVAKDSHDREEFRRTDRGSLLAGKMGFTFAEVPYVPTVRSKAGSEFKFTCQ